MYNAAEIYLWVRLNC